MEMAAQARALGIRFLDAPVTGSKEPAALGKLIFWVGGEAADVEACRPLFQCMGNRIVHGGKQGMGASLKMVMNQLLGTTMAAFAESWFWAGLLACQLRHCLKRCWAGRRPRRSLRPRGGESKTEILRTQTFLLRWLQKDLHLASVSAYETGVSLPLTNVAKEIYRFAIREGDGDKDFSAIYHLPCAELRL
jgi:glyoxylate/succinic semialdehyde reductase